MRSLVPKGSLLPSVSTSSSASSSLFSVVAPVASSLDEEDCWSAVLERF